MEPVDRLAPLAAAAALVLNFACGGPAPDRPDAAPSPAGSDVPALNVVGGFDRAVTLDPRLEADWVGVKIAVTDRVEGGREEYLVPLGGAELLGDSGLVLTAETFIPDFVMDEDGIRSRSNDEVNPAVRVRISEEGAADFEGWLFAAMPETLPFQHERYEVLLVEGVPAAAHSLER